LKTELTKVKEALVEEKAQNAKRHEDILAFLFALSAKSSPPPPSNNPSTLFSCHVLFPVFILFLSCFYPVLNTLFALLGCAFFTNFGLFYSWLVML